MAPLWRGASVTELLLDYFVADHSGVVAVGGERHQVVTSAEGIGRGGHRLDGDAIRMLGERCASGGVALPSINRLIANDFHFDTVRAGECGGGRTIGGTLHVNPGIIKGAASSVGPSFRS